MQAATSDIFYGAELARIHAEGFAAGMDAAVPWLADLATATGAAPFVFDLGCGDGRVLAALAARGVPGAGIDLSPDFVARARGRGLDVRRGDAGDATIPPATLVVALGEVLAYLDANGRCAFEPALAAAFAALPPGGSFVFDLIDHDIPAGRGWRDVDDWLVATDGRIDAGVYARRIVAFSRQPGDGGWRRSDEMHRQRVFEPAAVTAAAGDVGFDARPLTALGDAPLLPGRIAFRCVKP